MNTSRPRGRPRTFDRQAALEAAVALFWRHGYEGTSIADLTEALGVTPPTLYAAFGSKEQLYREALEHYIARDGDRAEVLRAEIPAYVVIEQYMRRAAERFTAPGRPPGCMISTASLNCAAENGAARAAAAALRDSSFKLLVEKLCQAVATGELPAESDVLALARFYSAVIQGMSVQAIDGASTADLNGLVDCALAAWPGRRPAQGAVRGA